MFNVATTLKGPDMGDFALLIGGLLIVLGYQSKGVKINRHTGFKTPWSMKDEDNWNYTNYIGGNLMMINGVIIIMFSNYFMYTIILMIITAVIIPFYLSYRFDKNKRDNLK